MSHAIREGFDERRFDYARKGPLGGVVVLRVSEVCEVGTEKFVRLPAQQSGPGRVQRLQSALRRRNDQQFRGELPGAVALLCTFPDLTFEIGVDDAQFVLASLKLQV